MHALVLAQKSTFDGWEIYGHHLKFPHPCHIYLSMMLPNQTQGESIYIKHKTDMK